MTMHILIVDADASAAGSTCAFVQRFVPGASVVCETTPESAWNAAQYAPPDLLLIDPGPFSSTSRLLIQLCKKSWPTMRALVLASAPVLPSRRQQFQAEAYLEKPTSPAQLRDTLTRLLGEREPAVARGQSYLDDASAQRIATGEHILTAASACIPGLVVEHDAPRPDRAGVAPEP